MLLLRGPTDVHHDWCGPGRRPTTAGPGTPESSATSRARVLLLTLSGVRSALFGARSVRFGPRNFFINAVFRSNLFCIVEQPDLGRIGIRPRCSLSRPSWTCGRLRCGRDARCESRCSRTCFPAADVVESTAETRSALKSLTCSAIWKWSGRLHSRPENGNFRTFRLESSPNASHASNPQLREPR